MRVTCDQLDAMLPEFFDGKLEQETLDAALDHLSTCDSCRLTVDELRSVGELYRQHPLRMSDEAKAKIAHGLADAEDGQ